jgi:hypothetical protein
VALPYDAVLGYHPYTLWKKKVRDPGDWRWLSGRWHYMEQAYGLKPDWIFTEAGPFESVETGWRSSECLGADRDLYIEAVRQWIRDTQQTPAYQEGRLKGFALFTTGRTSGTWDKFWTEQPELNLLAEMINQEWKPGKVVEPPPPPPPPPPKERGEPRVQYNRIVNVIPQDATVERAVEIFTERWQAAKESVGGSYDDAGIGDLDNRTARLHDIPAERHQEFIDWYAEHYPGVKVEFWNEPPVVEHSIRDIVDDLPKHETKRYRTRPLTDIGVLTIHHTVSPCDRSTAAIANYHVGSRGWPGIGYHFVVGCDGTIEQTNYLETVSYHVGEDNQIAVGIALKDNFTDHPPTQQAQDAARWLVAEIQDQLGNGMMVKPHKDMTGAQTACPGDTSPDWFPYVAGYN